MCNTNINKTIELIQFNLVQLEQWCLKNDLILNESKTKFIIFSKQKVDSSYANSSKFTLNSHKIQFVTEFKYLGFDNNLTFNKHYETVVQRVSSIISRIRGIKKFLTPKAFINVFNAYVLSVADYCIEIWGVQPTFKLYRTRSTDCFMNFLLAVS